jgi:cell division septation protein DedD
MQQHLGGYEEREDDSVGLMGDDRLDEFAAPRRRWPTAVLTGIVMAVFAGGLWFFYHQGVRQPAPGPGGEVPLIRADDKPMKMKPDQPGGMPVPDQNVSVYDPKPGAAPVEKLLPPPEQPMPRPVPREAAAPAPSTAPAQSTPAATAAPQQQAAATTAAPKAPAKPAPAKEPAATAPAKSVPAGPVRLQLASLRTPEAAKEEWSRLKREHPELLGRLTAVAVKADLGDKGVWYRVQTQSFDNAAAAERLCADLKKQNIGCSLAH